MKQEHFIPLSPLFKITLGGKRKHSHYLVYYFYQGINKLLKKIVYMALKLFHKAGRQGVTTRNSWSEAVKMGLCPKGNTFILSKFMEHFLIQYPHHSYRQN